MPRQKKGVKPQENTTHTRKPRKKKRGTEKKGEAEEHNDA